MKHFPPIFSLQLLLLFLCSCGKQDLKCVEQFSPNSEFSICIPVSFLCDPSKSTDDFVMFCDVKMENTIVVKKEANYSTMDFKTAAYEDAEQLENFTRDIEKDTDNLIVYRLHKGAFSVYRIYYLYKALSSDYIIIFSGQLFDENQAVKIAMTLKEEEPESSESGFQLAPGYYFGEVTEHIPKNKLEKTLLDQANDYNTLLLDLNIKKFKKYIYIDAVRFMAQHFPDSYTDDQIISAMYKTVDQQIRGKSVREVMKEKGAEFLVTSIEEPIMEGNKILVNFDIQLNFKAKGKNIYSKADKTIGISLDNGRNWAFISYSDNSREILRKRFKTITINKLLN